MDVSFAGAVVSSCTKCFTPCRRCRLYSLLITPSLLCRLNSVFKPSTLVDVSFAGAVVSSSTKCLTPSQLCWLYSLLITPCLQAGFTPLECCTFRASLYLCALFRGGLYPLLNSDTKIRAREPPSVFDDFFSIFDDFSHCQKFFRRWRAIFCWSEKSKKSFPMFFCIKIKKI